MAMQAPHLVMGMLAHACQILAATEATSETVALHATNSHQCSAYASSSVADTRPRSVATPALFEVFIVALQQVVHLRQSLAGFILVLL